MNKKLMFAVAVIVAATTVGAVEAPAAQTNPEDVLFVVTGS